MTAPSLPDFLLARLGEWEEAAQAVVDDAHGGHWDDEEPDGCVGSEWTTGHRDHNMLSDPSSRFTRQQSPELILATVAALRAVVSEHGTVDPCEGTFGPVGAPCPTLRALAGIWREHDDWREEWA